MNLRSFFSLLLAVSLSACGTSEPGPDVNAENQKEVCGDRVDGNGDGLDDYADTDCAVGEVQQAGLQELVDGVRGPVGALVLGVEKPDGTVGLVASGHVKEGGRALLVTDRFPIGSITKTFVAVVVLQLFDEGKITLDQTLASWLPSFPRAERITLRHLLSHTSGIFNYTSDPGFATLMFSGASATPSQMVDVAAANPPLFEPGEQYSYSNSNFVLLGLIIEAVTGNSAAAELRSRIFEPLGMKDTFLHGSEEVPGGLQVHGYLPNGTGADIDTTSIWNGTTAWTAGAALSTVPDMLRFSHGLHQGELLTSETYEAMKVGDGGQDYGYGLILGPGSIGHGGSVPGWLTEWVYLDDGTTAVAFQNRSDSRASMVRAINEAVRGL